MITLDEGVPENPRHLPERTGKHYCTLCLAEIPWEEFDGNDSLCNGCVEIDEHPTKAQARKLGL